MPKQLFVVLLLVVPTASSAQLCMPESQPQPNSGYAYVRTEVKALQWIRSALTESEKIQPPRMDDPERLHKTVELYTAVQTVSDDYDCALAILTPYKDSKNDSISTSVDSFLKAIHMTKEINADFVEMIEALNKATKVEDIDQQAIAKTLANVKSLQKDVRSMSMLAAKMSTFGILVIKEEGDTATPIAFSITAKQRETLLGDVRGLRGLKKKKGEDTYVDLCAEILLNTLTKQLRTSHEK
jgi:hypothetical protein